MKWFADAPSPSGHLGTPPLSTVSFHTGGDDPDALWVVAEHPVARQQLDYPDEFAATPDVLLQAEAYRLRDVVGLVLPADLDAVVGAGHEALNFRTHPFQPALLDIVGVRTCVFRRLFDTVRVDTAMAGDSWIMAISPRSAPPSAIVETAST